MKLIFLGIHTTSIGTMIPFLEGIIHDLIKHI